MREVQTAGPRHTSFHSRVSNEKRSAFNFNRPFAVCGQKNHKNFQWLDKDEDKSKAEPRTLFSTGLEPGYSLLSLARKSDGNVTVVLPESFRLRFSPCGTELKVCVGMYLF